MIYLKIGLASLLSLLYCAYFVEMYRHLTRPLQAFYHQSKKKRMQRLVIFFVGISLTILLAYIIRQFILPRPIFDLIVVSLEAIFIIPFFGAIFTDRLLHAWRQQRLPYPFVIATLIVTACISAGTNLLIVFGSKEMIISVTHILSVATDLIAVCFVLVLGFLGLGYWQSKK